MESFTIDLVNIAPAQLFPDKRYISFTNFLPEQLKLEGQGEVANSAKGYPLLYQMSSGENSCLSIQKFQSCWNFTNPNPVSTLPFLIMLKP